ARLHRGLDTKVDTATVANRGDPAVQQLLEIGFRREELHRERLLLNALQVHAVVLRVNVAIEQARGEQGIRRVDDGLAVDSRDFARDLADAAMLDRDIRVDDANAIEHPPTSKDCASHRTKSSTGVNSMS